MGFVISFLMKQGFSEGAAGNIAALAKWALIAFVLFTAYTYQARHHFNRGVTHCEEQQAKSDAVIEDEIIPETSAALDEVEETKQVERVEVHKTYTTGLTASDITLARQEGVIAGEKAGRKEVYDQINENGGCLTQLYGPNDGLQNKARAQQQRFFKAGVGSYTRNEAEEELSGGPSQVNTFSDGEPVTYPQPY